MVMDGRTDEAGTGMVIPKVPRNLRVAIRTQALLAGRPMYEWLVREMRRLIRGEREWGVSGSERIRGGRLRAETDTDYLVFRCPTCDMVMAGGIGVAIEGVLYQGGEASIVGFRFQCPSCGMRDCFKIAAKGVDVPSAVDVLRWPRPGKPSASRSVRVKASRS
jgi:predicted RNA-binding Zn-ribbon protein involved in translation (DUF1610 family)